MKPPSIPMVVAERVLEWIRQFDLQPGDQLPGHRELAETFAVSLGSIREAISMLITAGYVETRAGRGTFVAADRRVPGFASRSGRPLQRKEVEEIIEWREIVEFQAAEMAAQRAAARDIARLREITDRMQQAADDARAYPAIDVEFHLALADACGNRFLARALEDIRTVLERDMELSTEAAIRRHGDLQFSVDSHRILVDAIAAGEPERAREILFDITSRHHEFVLSLYAADDGDRSSAPGSVAP